MTRTIRVIRERYTVEDDGHGGSMSVETSTDIDTHEIHGTHALLADDFGRNVTEHESPAREAVGIIRRENLSYGADGGEWFGRAESSTVDYSTGEEERVTAHLDGFSETETRTIIRMTEWLDRRDTETARRYAETAPRFYGDTARR